MEGGLPRDLAITSRRENHGLWDCTVKRNLNRSSFMLERSANSLGIKWATLGGEADLREIDTHSVCGDWKNNYIYIYRESQYHNVDMNNGCTRVLFESLMWWFAKSHHHFHFVWNLKPHKMWLHCFVMIITDRWMLWLFCRCPRVWYYGNCTFAIL